ncbi:FimB/Mfa2 family fimbrial subunit [Porphyromonas uenonis]|uniref:FimB/Mfa2 family fimbrial subunit n=1 Tax=Porphyromonas uenonis TaxID=281920 RepID=UPI00288C4293|nr:FimB/Mfa2 family fimbrial subunit [Porphyromonas uenonis]
MVPHTLSRSRLLYIGVMLLLSWSFVSCDKCIYEDLSSCPLRVQLRYDYNMQYVDRWHREAEDVHLYVFDEAGRFVSEMIDAAAPYEEKQTFELRLDPGNYTIMALCGHRMGTLYKESKLQVGTSTMQDLLVEISRAEDKRIATELPPLLYGVSKEVKIQGDGSRLIVVPMAKWTNSIRLVMQDLSEGGKSNIKLDNYDFRITAPNGRYNGAGEVLTDDVLTYTPYYAEQLKGTGGIAVELNTLRLLTNQKQRLIITERATGKELLNVDLLSLLLQTKFYANNKLSDQEFLDREDRYAIIFAFDGRPVTQETFLAVSVWINGWLIREQDHNI